MKKVIISKDRNRQFETTASNLLVILDEDVRMAVKKGIAFYASNPDQHDVTFRLLGDISNSSSAVYTQSGEDIDVYVGKNSSISTSFYGVVLGGAGNTLENHGQIKSDIYGAAIGDGGKVLNSGVISGTTNAIYTGTEGGAGEIVNKKGGVIAGGDTAIVALDLQMRLQNSGTIRGGEAAAQLSSDNDSVLNTGTIRGDLLLGDGNDLFTNRGGVMRGEVIGGKGDDVYAIDKASLKLVEDLSGGTDTVKASVSFTLGANVERLILTGGKAIDGDGNALANRITGNAKANELDGHGGKDVLTGGGAADIFHFSEGGGRDTVTDFAHAVDHIDVSGLDIASFDQLDITYGAGGATLSFGHGDVLVLKGVTAGLDAGDFIFA